MPEICRGVTSDNDTLSTTVARRRRMKIRRFKFFAGISLGSREKRKKMEDSQTVLVPAPADETREICNASLLPNIENHVNYGMASICGRRRDMEDAVSVHPSFCRETTTNEYCHFFGLYDGHGCSHVAMRCRDRLHRIVKEELEESDISQSSSSSMSPANNNKWDWEKALKRSFKRMDGEAVKLSSSRMNASCRCELQTPECDAVGSTAVVSIVTPKQLIVANCGDSRAVLCHNGKPIPLSYDHKPDRPDELDRIQASGGRVIYWDGPRVLGVLAMSRAIGDNYLKPYVSCEPEVTITDRKAEDDCLILASDGLWDVVSNEMACGVVSMCIAGKACGAGGGGIMNANKGCSDAVTLLTKLALARKSTDNVSVIVVDLKRGAQL